MSELLRSYEPNELAVDGYPAAWSRCPTCDGRGGGYNGEGGTEWECPDCWRTGSIKALVRHLVSHRCIRCGHPYRSGKHGTGEWSPCDERCAHQGPGRYRPGWSELGEGQGSPGDVDPWSAGTATPHTAQAGELIAAGIDVEARWRILTVHHLDGDKANCRWWNLAALCQRCHLAIQGKVQMARVWPWEHSDWFRPYVAGYYAHAYLDEDLERDDVEDRLDELLALERAA